MRDLHLGRFTSQNDVDAEDFEPGRGNLPWVSSVTDEEAKWVTTACQNKAPGADAISVRLLRTAWPSIGHAVRVLFEGSLRLNHFPKAFKLAEVILLPKPGRNLSTAKGWRPIALLSSLGKGLERLIARRMAYTALTYKAVPQQLFGALTGRSANDLVSCVIHDVEHAMKRQKKAVLVVVILTVLHLLH